LIGLSLSGLLLLLTGCGPQAGPTIVTICTVEGNNGGITSYRCRTTITWPFETPETSSDIGTAVLVGSSIIDLQGTTVSVPANGLYSVSLIDSFGNTYAQSSFPWSKVNNQIVPTNQIAISSWITNSGGDVKELKIELLPITVGTQQGVNAFMTTLQVNGSVMGVAADVWTDTGCPNGPQINTSNCLSGF
jgi:hypothetical protein